MTKAPQPITPSEWVRNLERAASTCKGSHVRVSRARLMQLCLLTRLTIQMLNSVDEGNAEAARAHLKEFVATLESPTLNVGLRKQDILA